MKRHVLRSWVLLMCKNDPENCVISGEFQVCPRRYRRGKESAAHVERQILTSHPAAYSPSIVVGYALTTSSTAVIIEM